MPDLAHVIPLAPVDGVYTYRVPDDMGDAAVPGARVLVSFGRRTITGVIAERVDGPTKGLKSITDVLDERPSLTPELLQLTRWIADYYLCPWGEAIRAALPGGTVRESERVLQALVPPEEWAGAESGRKILKALAGFADQQASTSDLATALKRKTVPQYAIRQLEAADAVIVEDIVREATVAKRMVRHLRLTDADLPEKKLGAKQQALLDVLVDHPEGLSRPDALAASRSSSSTAKRLEELGLLKSFDVEVERRADGLGAAPDEAPPEVTLHSSQEAALTAIRASIEASAQQTFLLEGVTGSGKTEVYLRALRTALDLGQTAIVLVPEIALTPQTVRRFRAHFGDRIAVMHSRMSPGERLDAWTRIRNGVYPVVIGPRSAVLAPLQNVGLIIVDEEHEASYKQFDPAPRYNARDVAVFRASRAGAVCVLGSATPSLESVANARSGKYVHLTMPDRVPVAGRDAAPLPSVRLIDLTREREIRRLRGALSHDLREAIGTRLEKREQVILLQNRRGYAPVVTCNDCGWAPECRDCAVSLTVHTSNQTMRCHYCGRAEKRPQVCPQCGSDDVALLGAGTQRVEEELIELFPTIRLLRMDMDTTSKRGAHRDILERFGRGDADVLLGTQMVAKGLDFPRVTLVGVVDADAGMLMPDFRASERTFQLLAQVGGRAGRHDLEGEVLLQSRNPAHPALRHALNHDVAGFTQHELAEREALGYPPFGRIIGLEFKGPDEGSTRKLAQRWTDSLAADAGSIAGAVVLGPVPAFVGRVKTQWRFHTLLKAPRSLPARVGADMVRELADRLTVPSKHRVNIDVDPVGLF